MSCERDIKLSLDERSMIVRALKSYADTLEATATRETSKLGLTWAQSVRREAAEARAFAKRFEVTL